MADERSRPAAPGWRLALLGLGIVGLLSVVALAARGHMPGGGGETNRVRADIVVEYVFLFYVLLALTVGPLLAYALWSGRRAGYELPERKRWMARVFGTMVLVAIALAGVMASRLLRADGDRRATSTAAVASGTGTAARDTARPLDFDWGPVIVMGSLFAVAAGVAGTFVVRSRPKRTRDHAAIALELSNVLDETLDDLRAERHARRAVVAAYARMERALAWFGLPRSSFEAPLEYLARVLAELHASAEAVTRLTALFERAKFSRHEIGPELKEEAIEALVTVRDELRAYA